jgi:tetratricopeptide (TPR) repeat protein
VDLDGNSPGPEITVDDGLHLECLGAACRFFSTGGDCGLESQITLVQDLQTNLVRQQANLAALEQQLNASDERWENILLTLVELTERFETVLDHFTDLNDRRPDPGRANISAEDRDAARDLNSDGIEFYHNGELEKAAACFHEAIVKYPGFVEAYNNLGLVETELGRKDEAVSHFEKAISLDPELSASYTNLGYVYYLEESYLDAICMYEEALKRSANNSTVWTNLGNVHYKLRNLDKAREAWEKAIALDPTNTKAAQNLSQISEETPV